ncbi:hypothetical protein MMYC01_203695 [Madurella mycetomatis]|uniref:Uncharacterized protein n=1 Tax=Madurella mycetomatis TaxID=100816 RepID=A0A175W617_9PEZI|nr:hypothetical protein MMYC01_203695 [Madurella mycetomatis]
MHRLLVHLVTLLLVVSLAELAACKLCPATTVYQFPDDTFIENLLALPSGHVLLSTFGSGNLLSIDPRASSTTPRTVAKLGNATGLTAIAPLSLNLYAVAGGVHAPFSFVNNTMALYVVLVIGPQPTGVVITSIPVPGTTMMNGLAALPNRPSTVLSADSISGRLLRINTITREVDVAWTDPAIGAGGNTDIQFGINGIKIVGNYLYFTNSGQGTFARVPIDNEGNKAGSVQIIATLPMPANMSYAFDDFDFDRCGNAYVAMHSSSVVKITPSGEQTVVAGGPGFTPELKSPTSVSTATDGKSIYISTGGESARPVIIGGQVVTLELPSTC